ncbi:hypothetical protein LOK49_LG08G01099 [Camellia lanceoleosa]|uniref:Uncharacterized protein n=1 Tax=Camellia lanceoleosa TaxID=1840588 RepID=A0ACC0GMP5_9ERIC|nr:hypothetical protein LOK49_LG08G01099 [Camellia lanceoleosa]
MCPFLKQLRKLSKSIVDTKNDVVKLKTEMNEIKQHDNVMTMRSPLVATDIVELNSVTSNVQKLLKFLDKDSKRIDIFGIEEVGKTTLSKKLHAKASQKHRFGIVILVSCHERTM